MSDSESTNEKQNKPWLFKPGTSGNPAGRPKGSRQKLGEDFIADLHEAWRAKGKAAIDVVVSERPHEFLKVVAGLLPKDINVKVDTLSEMDEQELAAVIASLRALTDTCAAQIARAGTGEESGPQPVEIIPPLH